jgi:tetratricopeptide (TPR) repeat protein
MAISRDRFPTSSDVASWATCLDGYERDLDLRADAGRLDAAKLVQGLCVSIYTQWLGALSGKFELEERGKGVYDGFVETLRDLHRRTPSSGTRRGWGVVLAWSGYHSKAKEMLAGTGELVPEIALLVLPTADADRAAFLRPFVSETDETTFPLALYFYCDALINLGATEEANQLLDRSGLDKSDAIVRDLMGNLHERSGRWREACEAYSRSSWHMHRYRAAMIRTIAAGDGFLTSDEPALVVDKPLLKALSQFASEINQVELARCTSFVNACLWNDYDDWLIRFELGKLSFRRRRYAEADAHLKKALARAPPTARFVIASLRFSNLTWLTNSSVSKGRSMDPEALESQDLPMEPEALESAHAALKATADDRESADIRVWVASRTGETALLPRDIETWDAFDQAKAHAIVGNKPEALGCGLRCFRQSYYHRNLVNLISTFNVSRFESCVEYLLELIIRESWDDFFPLWELADFLLETRSQLSESSRGFQRLSKRLDDITERLEELSQFDFQHLIRAHDLFSQMKRQDTAERLVRRAGQLAEGAAENLAVAIARRKAEWFNDPRSDPQGIEQGIECLLKAAREARDTLERLQIARELYSYGRAREGRGILIDEGILASGRSFEPIEYIVALQCRRWLEPDEYNDLVQRAASALFGSFETRAIERYGGLFLDRLVAATELDIPPTRQSPRPIASDGQAGDASDTEGASMRLQDGPWKAWRDKIELADDFEEEKSVFEDGAARLSASSTFETRFAIWSLVHRELERALDDAARVRPKLERQQIPISKNLTLDDDWRALELADRWRRYLSCNDAESRETARQAVDSFYAVEKRLLGEWEAERRKKAERPLRKALFYAEFAVRFLPTLVSEADRSESHPLLRSLYECAAKDCESLARRAADRAQSIQRELSAAESLT